MSNRELKVKALDLKNIKCYESKTITLDGKSVHFVGDNGVGKTTILQMAKKFLFENDIKLSEVLKQGETEGKATAVLEDQHGNKFIGELKYRKNAKGEEVETYTLTGPDGGKFDKKGRDALFGERFLFDPVKFVENQSSAAGRAKNLEQVFKPLLGVDLSEEDDKIKSLSEQRRLAGAEQKTISAMFDGQGLTLDDVEKEYKKPDVAAIKAKLDAEAAKERQMKNLAAGVDRGRETIRVWQLQIEQLKQNIIDQQVAIDQMVGELEGIGHSDSIEKLQAEYEGAVNVANRIEGIERLRPQADKLIKATVEYEQLTEQINALRSSKIAAIEAASKKLPPMFRLAVNDKEQLEMRFIENGVDLPFDDVNIPRSRMIISSVVLGMEFLKDSPIRVITIEDASLLGKKAYDVIMDAVNEHRFQALVEEVGDQPEVDIRLITEITNPA